MNPSPEVKAAYDEVLKKIGRNLLLFQQAEHLIKRLVFIDAMSLRSGESAQKFKERDESYSKMTMGQVAKLFLDRLCSTTSPADSDPLADAPCKEGGFVSVRVRLDIGLDTEARRKSFDHLIEQRNDLVHHQLQRLHPESLENLLRVSDELDRQRRDVLPEIQRLQQDFENTRSMIETLAAFLETPPGMAELLQPEIRQSPLIRNLAGLASQSSDPEGWTSLGEATKKLEDFPATEILKHCNQLGQKSLTALLHASGLFDTRQQEANAECHGRTFYRLKSTSSLKIVAASETLPGTKLFGRLKAEQ